MRRRTKIIATVGPQRTTHGKNPTTELGDATRKNKIPHGQLLERFIHAGADIIRVNMSFATRGEHYGADEGQYLKWLNQEQDGIARAVAVLGDLPGPKIRLADISVPKEAELVKKDHRFNLTFGEGGVRTPGARVLVYEKAFNESVKGVGSFGSIREYIEKSGETTRFSIGDGKVELKAKGVYDGDIVECEVTSEVARWDEIQVGKGLTVKEVSLKVDPFQEPDKKALKFLLDHAGEMLAYVAVSFVQSQRDILEVRHFIEDYIIEQHDTTIGHDKARLLGPGVIAKIETREAWKGIDHILDVADGVMVARGDLGEKLPREEVPAIQKQLIEKCNVRGKPVITATQMLDSMEKNEAPTRAEATDVFNAILDGTDAVMLSGETATGIHPIRAIGQMVRIAEEAEKYYYKPANRRKFTDIREASREQVADNTVRLEKQRKRAADSEEDGGQGVREWFSWVENLYKDKIGWSSRQATTDEICAAACALAEAGKYESKGGITAQTAQESGDCKAILVTTTSGRTVFMISRFRSEVQIIGAAHYRRTFRKLLLSFGVRPIFIDVGDKRTDEALEGAFGVAKTHDLLSEDDKVIFVSGAPLHTPGAVNVLQIIDTVP